MYPARITQRVPIISVLRFSLPATSDVYSLRSRLARSMLNKQPHSPTSAPKTHMCHACKPHHPVTWHTRTTMPGQGRADLRKEGGCEQTRLVQNKMPSTAGVARTYIYRLLCIQRHTSVYQYTKHCYVCIIRPGDEQIYL